MNFRLTVRSDPDRTALVIGILDPGPLRDIEFLRSVIQMKRIESSAGEFLCSVVQKTFHL